jgi:hypothetical protein
MTDDTERAMFLWKRMMATNNKPDMASFGIIIHACAKRADFCT